jgi:hypothetical protein
LTLFSLSLVLLTTTGATEPIRLAAPGFTGVNVEASALEFYNEHVAQQLSAFKLKVVTHAEIATLLGMERQRALMGCDETSSACMAELANALGADAMLMGGVARIGSAFQVNLKIISSKDGTQLAKYSSSADGEEALLNALTRGAGELARAIYPKLGRGEAPEPAAMARETTGTVRRMSWIPGAAGIVLLGAGVAMLALSEGRFGELQPSTPITLSDAQRIAREGEEFQTYSRIGFAAGGACLLAAGLMYLFGGGGVQTAVWFSPHGGGVAFSGALP